MEKCPNLTAKEIDSNQPYIVTFGIFKYELYSDDLGNGLRIYIHSFYDDMDIIDTEPAFMKTDTAIAHIRKELKRVAKDILKSLK